MADELRMALAEVLRKAGVEDADFLRDGMRVLAQELMEIELEQHVGAARHERTAERSGYRNGYRERTWDTRVGTIELQVPRVRDGSLFPSLLEPRRRAARASGRGPSGIRAGCVEAARGRAGSGAGHAGHQQEPGEPPVRRAGHRGRALSDA